MSQNILNLVDIGMVGHLGDSALATMRRVKFALDPEGRFAPGVLFPA